MININGTLVIEGSTIEFLEVSRYVTAVEWGNKAIIDIRGGTWKGMEFIEMTQWPCVTMTGGRLLPGDGMVNTYTFFEQMHPVQLSGLPANAQITQLQQLNTSTREAHVYGTNGCVTEGDGKIWIGNFEALSEDNSGKLEVILSCDGKYYRGTLSTANKYEMEMEELSASELHVLHTCDFTTGELLYDVFLKDKDPSGEYLPVNNMDEKQYTYEYYKQDKTTRFESADQNVGEETIYLKRTVKLYTITFGGALPFSEQKHPYGYRMPATNKYYYVTSEGRRWDGHVTEDITVTALDMIVRNNRKYIVIDTPNDMLWYAKAITVLKNDEDLNGVLTADIDMSSIEEFQGVLSLSGHFDGNGHSITIAIETNEECGALFQSTVRNATIENLTTKGTITTGGVNAGGIVGRTMANTTISNCISEVDIIYTPGGEAYAGGILGDAFDNVTINSCIVRGAIASGTEEKPITKYGGFIGEKRTSRVLSLNSCILGTSSLALSDSQNFVANDAGNANVTLKDCYYLSPIGTSTQGEQKDASFLNAPAMAWHMNTQNGTLPNAGIWTIANGKLNMLTGENKAVYRVLFNSESTYALKTGSKIMAYSDPQTGKVSSLPDMSDFVYQGQTYEWLYKGEKLTGEEVFTEDCEVLLRASGGEAVEVTIGGAREGNLTLTPGTELPDLDKYMYFLPSGTVVRNFDPSITALVAKHKVIVDAKEYMQIDTLEDMELFRKAINAGSTINGYLNADLNLGNAVAIGTAEHPFAGVFDGNGHTITLAIVESGQTDSRALFGVVGTDAIIRNVMTTGSIQTNGKFAGGIAGEIKGSAIIVNCGSDVTITFDIDSSVLMDGDATCGGIVGCAHMNQRDVLEIENCFYAGKMIGKSTAGRAMNGQGGLCGWCDTGIMDTTNCFVDAEFSADVVDSSETFARGGGMRLTDCYFTDRSKLNSEDDPNATQITAEELASREFAYRLNTRDGEQANAMVWTYVDEASHPTFANAERKATCKVTLVPDSELRYFPQISPISLWTDSEGKVQVSEVTLSGLFEGDIPSWENADGPVTDNTVLASDGTLTLQITMTKASLASWLNGRYEQMLSEEKYTTASCDAYRLVRSEILTLKNSYDANPDAVTEEQLIAAGNRLEEAQNALVRMDGALTIKSSDGTNEIESLSQFIKGRYAEGDAVTFSALELAGYNFVGWFRNEEQTPVTTAMECSVTFGDTNVVYTARYEALPTSIVKLKWPVDYGVHISGTSAVSEGALNQDEFNFSNTYSYRNGSEVTIEAKAKDFVCWVNEYNKVVSTSNAYTFTVTGSTELTAIYAKVDKSTVMYQSGYGQILKSYVVNASEIDSVVEPTTAPAKFGYEFEKWSLTKEEIKAKIEAGESLIKVTALYTANVNNHTITVTNGTGGGSFAYGTVVHVIPNTPQDGFKFSHWKDVTTGKVVSYQDEFCFYANRDMNVEAVYVDVNAEVVETGTAEIMQVKVDDVNKKVSFTAMLTVPENCTIELAGIIATDDATIGSDATSFTAEKAKFVRGDAWTGVTYYYTWTKSNVGEETWYARAYLVYKDENGNTQTVYGDIKPSK